MRTAFVTGAGSGLGRAIAERLARGGFRVVVTDVDLGSAEVAAKEIGEPAVAIRCDVSDLVSVQTAAEVAGDVDLLVNNAGFDDPQFFLETDPSSWRRLLGVNLEGVLNCTYVLAPVIVRRAGTTGYGRIVNVASDAGRVGSLGEAVYSAAKGGVIAFSKSMARELARDRVTVNAVCPGPADTPMTERISTGSALGAKMMTQLVGITPLRRLVRAEEVAAAVAYFASDDAAIVTGQSLSLSGGLTMA